MKKSREELLKQGNEYSTQFFNWRECLIRRYARFLRLYELDAPANVTRKEVALIHEAEAEYEKYESLAKSAAQELGYL